MKESNALSIKLPKPILIPVPQHMLNDMVLRGDRLQIGKLGCRVKGTTPYICIRSWSGVVLAIGYRLDLKKSLEELMAASTEPEHETLVNLIRELVVH